MNIEMHDENEQGSLGKDELAVSRLVQGLPRVDAPAGFNSRVMSVIADGRRPRRGFFRVPALAYAVSLVVVVVFGAFLVFKFRQPAVAQPESLAHVDVPAQNRSADTVTQSSPEAPLVAENVPAQSEADKARQTLNTAQKADLVNSNRGGSNTFSLPQTKPILPDGVGPRPQPSPPSSNDVVRGPAVGIDEILMMLGMMAKFNNGWQVTAVTGNSSAERSGIRVGDVVISLDDRVLTRETSYQGSGTFSSVKVRRDGKVVSVKLK